MRIVVKPVELKAARQMNFDDGIQVEFRQELHGVESQIAGVSVDVVQIQQKPAARAAAEFSQELRFGKFGVREFDEIDIVFEKERRRNGFMHFVHTRPQQFKGRPGSGQWHRDADVIVGHGNLRSIAASHIAMRGEVK